MKRFCLILSLVASLALAPLATAEQIQWKEASHAVQGKNLTDPKQTDVEIYGSNGTITIVTPRRIDVKVYTILGQLVSQATLQPGTHDLKVGSRGIYLVRIGNIAQKVAL